MKVYAAFIGNIPGVHSARNQSAITIIGEDCYNYL